MIPKIIHYCWFGRGKKSKLIEKCIKSWKKYCPDYKIIEWNEDNFDINSNTYVKEAYESKKWAFVSDYVRLFALCSIGGIYLDTDMEIIKNIDALLNNESFSGFEDENYIAAGIMGCSNDDKLFKEFFSHYKNEKFLLENGKLNTQSNVSVFTEMLINKGLVLNGKTQKIEGCTLYPRDYFYPFDDQTGKMTLTENSFCVHWYDKSWIDKKFKVRSKIARPFRRIFGVDCFEKFKRIKKG